MFKVFVRHGQSEHNEALRIFYETGDLSGFTSDLLVLGERRWSLTAEGRQQAAVTGVWIRREFTTTRFDHLYVSPYVRTIQTAEALALGLDHRVDERLREQCWGSVNTSIPTASAEETRRFIKEVYERDFGCVPSDGGESLASIRRERTDPFWSFVEASHPTSNDIFVAHGGSIRCLRMRIENMADAEHVRICADRKYKLCNCQVIIYSDRDPETGERAGRLSWVKSVCPQNPECAGHDWYRF